jgi:type I restriction enzyme, S subunit
MTWPLYPACRDSGSDWIGSIPDTWRTAQLKRVATRITDGAHVSPETDGGVYDFVSTRDVGERGIDFEGSLKTTPASYDYLVRNGCRPTQGDVLFSKDGTIGRTTVVATDHPFVVASSLIIIKPNRREVIPEFLHYVCQSTSVLDQVDSFVRGAGLPRLSIANLTKIIAAFPPVGEQGQIVRFLDRETDKIDALIGKQEQLIATLREDRTATITHAVTKGLDPDVEMKDFGIGWFEKVPAHWSVPQIGMHAAIGNGSTPSRENPAYWNDGNVPWLNSGHVNSEEITEADQFVTELALRECHLPLVSPGSVLVGLTGQGKTRGMASILLARSTINQHLAYLTPTDHRLDGHYLQRVLGSAYRLLRDISDENGSTKGGLTCAALRKVRIPLPPLHEQREIVEFLNVRCGNIDVLIAKANEVIETLREYRSALITDAVTGKIDVRGAA